MDARQYGYTDRGSKTFDLSIGLALSSGTFACKGSLNGKVVCFRDIYDGSQHCSSNSRRIWVYNGLSRSDVLSGLQIGGNRRRNITNLTEHHSSAAWTLNSAKKVGKKFMEEMEMGGAKTSLILDGIRALDLSQYLAGPYSRMLLTYIGAEVMRVEKPGGAENSEVGAFASNGQQTKCAIRIILAQNKRSITFNLLTKRGEELLAIAAVVLLKHFKGAILL